MTFDITETDSELGQHRRIAATCAPRHLAPRSRLPSAGLGFTKEATERSIPERFEHIVARCADRIAVKTRSQTLTYESLNRAANRVAGAILALGRKRGEPVALCFDHDSPMIVAILGVLKAGSVYVPVDPSFPLSRTRYIVEDAQAAVMVTNTANLFMARELTKDSAQLVNIDDIGPDAPTDNPRLSISPDDIAYILYTSGSTGKPKGVLQTHRNVLQEVLQYSQTLLISPQDRMTLLYSYSVNGAVRGIFGALFNGAALYPVDVRKEGLTSLASMMVEERVTFYHSVPTIFRSLAAALTGQEQFPCLRVIRLGGERVLARDVELYRKHFPDDCILYTGLVATETGQVSEYFLDKQSQVSGHCVPTGYPVAERDVVVLDEGGRDVGVNCVGEIAIKSRYLSPGYWRRPELTQALFSPDPEGTDKRIYRTGDLGRMRADGCLEHVGRKDFQAKIRGYRIEVAEVEMALLDCPGIEEAVVLVRDDAPGGEQVVGYVVVGDQAPRSFAELRRMLKERLPDYMIPSAFVTLASIPLTPNGKVDFVSLPAPEPNRPESKTPFVLPEGRIELRLTELWEDVLGVRPIGVHDDFFELGGHSLRAVQLIGQIEKAFDTRLAPAILFQAPTIRQLAGILCHGELPESQSSLLPIQRGGSTRPFFWVHGDSSNRILPRYLRPDQPMYALEHQCQDGTPARYTEVETIAAEYLKEIRSVQPHGPYSLGGYSFGGTVAFDMAQQLREQGEEVAVLFLLDSNFPGRNIEDADLPINTPAPNDVRRYLHEFGRRRGFREKLAYLLPGLRAKIAPPVTKACKKAFKKAVCQAYLALGRRLPASLRSFYILGIYTRARQRYVPRPFSGQAIYVRCNESTEASQRNWERLMKDGIELLEVPGDHNDMMKEEAVRAWAKPLTARLQEANAQPS